MKEKITISTISDYKIETTDGINYQRIPGAGTYDKWCKGELQAIYIDFWERNEDVKYRLTDGKIKIASQNAINSQGKVNALTAAFDAYKGGPLYKSEKRYYFDEEDGTIELEYTTGYVERPVTANFTKIPGEEIAKILKFGLVLTSTESMTVYVGAEKNGKRWPLIEYFRESPYFIKNKAPQSGETASAKDPISFSWQCDIPGPGSTNPEYAYVTKVVRGYKFVWRRKGTEIENAQDIGPNNTITIPAGTFEPGDIEWKVEGRMDNSVPISPSKYAGQEWTTLKITGPDPQSTARIIRPKDTIITTQEPVEFVWEHVIATGTEQTKAELQKSRNGSSYTAMATIQGAGNTYTLPPNSIEPGAFWWRVRTYNTEGLAGFWSEPARLSVIGKPKAPAVSMQRVSPRPEIKWTSEVQEAYEVKITNADGIVEKRQRFGTEKLYKTEKYLEDGTYTASVRVQNIYGYWSDWASTSFTVKNVPGPAIRLTAAGVNIVNLSWTGRSGATFLVYRNGNLIARTTNKTYKDQFAAGEVEYQVRGIADTTGNYAVSNKVRITVKIDHMQVADVNKPVWLDLGRSINELRTTSNPTRQSVAYSHFAGQALPSAEIGEYMDKSYSFDVAWRAKDRAAIDAFEALTGHLVCIKTITGRAIFGILNDVDTKENKLVASSTATITVVEWQEAGI